jgi:hypothetical protein
MRSRTAQLILDIDNKEVAPDFGFRTIMAHYFPECYGHIRMVLKKMKKQVEV